MGFVKDWLGTEYVGNVTTSPAQLFAGDPGLGGDLHDERSGVLLKVSRPVGAVDGTDYKVYVYRLSSVSAQRNSYEVWDGETKLIPFEGDDEFHIVGSATIPIVAQQVLVRK